MRCLDFLENIRWLTALGLILFLSACGGAGDGADPEETRPAIRPVKAILLQAHSDHATRKFPGIARALQDTPLSFRVGGPLILLNAQTGQYVEQDEVVAKIDPRDYLVRINSLQARLDASQAQLTESRLQYHRYERLIAENAAARATFDRVKAAFEMAEAQVRGDSKNLENARNALTDTRLQAPFSGYVDKEFVENHQVVATGQPVISMVDLSAVEVDVALPEDLLPDVGSFTSYTCRFDVLPGRTFPAGFKEIGKQPNPSNRTYPLTLTVAQDENNRVRPGMSAEVSIRMKTNHANNHFIVPVSVVGNDADRKSFAWEMDPATGRLTKKPVAVHGFAANNRIEISGDLSAGKWVVAAGVNSLTENQKVRLLTSAGKSNAGNEL